MLALRVGTIANLVPTLPAPAQYLRQHGVGVHGADARYAVGVAEIDTERGSAVTTGENPHFSCSACLSCWSGEEV